MKKKVVIGALVASCAIPAVHAEDPPKNYTPAVSDILSASGISISGYYDVAYNRMNSTGLFVNAPAGPVSAGLAGNSHIFDTPGATQGRNFNSFNLQQVGLVISRQPKQGFGGYFNVTAGEDAATIASTGFGAAPAGSNNSSHVVDLTQAYASYATGDLTVIGGKFATLAGVELISSPSNKNYTHAWMFGWGPYTHTGLRATYVFNDKVTLIAGVNNGWDQVTSTTSSKTTELSLVLSPANVFSLATTYYQGREVAVAPGTRKYLDVIGTLNATDQLNFVVDYANGKQANASLPTGTIGEARWNALAAYVNYQFSDVWRAAYRWESFDDRDGYRSGLATAAGTPVGQKLASNTLTIGYAAAKNMELRGEVRFDKSSQNAFLQSNGTGRNSQNQVALQAVYQF